MQEAYRLAPNDRVMQKTPYSFDVSIWELFWPLLSGSALVLVTSLGHRDPRELSITALNKAVTVMHFVPVMLRSFFRLLGAQTLFRVTAGHL